MWNILYRITLYTSFNERSAFPNVTAASMEKIRNAISPIRAVAYIEERKILSFFTVFSSINIRYQTKFSQL